MSYHQIITIGELAMEYLIFPLFFLTGVNHHHHHNLKLLYYNTMNALIGSHRFNLSPCSSSVSVSVVSVSVSVAVSYSDIYKNTTTGNKLLI